MLPTMSQGDAGLELNTVQGDRSYGNGAGEADRHHLAHLRANALAAFSSAGLGLGAVMGLAFDGAPHPRRPADPLVKPGFSQASADALAEWPEDLVGWTTVADPQADTAPAEPTPLIVHTAEEHLSREQLKSRLAALRGGVPAGSGERERLLHELQTHQIELEIQNRDLQESQAAVEASRNRYADLYDLAPVAYFTFDPNGVILEANLAGAAMLGRERAQLLGLPFLALVHSIDTAAFWSHFRRCRGTEMRVASEFSFSTRRSGHVDVQAVSTPVLDGTGRRVGVRTTLTDISERKKAEAERARALEAEHRVRAQFEHLDRAAIAMSQALTESSIPGSTALPQVIADQARLLLNAEFAALSVAYLGVDGSFEPFVYSGLDSKVRAAIGRAPQGAGLLGSVMRDGRTIRVRELSKHPAFEGFPPNHPPMGSFLGVPIRFAGRVLGHLYLTNKRGAPEFSTLDEQGAELLAEHVGIVLEIARLRDLEARDRERLERLAHAGDVVAATLDNNLLQDEMAKLALPWFADCCVILRPGPEGLEAASMAHADAVNGVRLCTPGPMIGKDDMNIFADAWRTRRAAVHPEVTFADLFGNATAPDFAPRSALIVPMVKRGELLGLIAFVRGVEARQFEARDVPIAEEIAHRCVLALENARLYDEAQHAVDARDRQLATAQAAIAGRDGVLRIVAHDLRSPLTGIRLLGDSLRRQAQTPEHPSHRPLDMLRRTVDRMDRLIQDLLDVARLDGGTLPIQRGPVDAQSVCSDAVDAQRLVAADSGLEIIAEVVGQPPRVFADRTRLLQAIDNLIGNAIKFSNCGGRITVRAEQTPLGDVVFSVQDCGLGIPEEHVSHLFEKFWQGCDSDRRGAGLGLSIVKGIADAHGGRVWVDSVVGQGSTFHVAIPRFDGGRSSGLELTSERHEPCFEGVRELT